MLVKDLDGEFHKTYERGLFGKDQELKFDMFRTASPFSRLICTLENGLPVQNMSSFI